MTQKIALITDSTCDLPRDYFSRYDISFVPIYLIWDGKQYRDQVDITSEEFYQRITSSRTLPKSSQPSLADFTEAYERAISNGAEEIVVITISEKMSGTKKVALQAAESVLVPVHIFDSRTGGTGLALQVLAAARAREAGGGAAEMLKAAKCAQENMLFVFFVDSLESLRRGGRIGMAATLIGTALNLKPVLYANPREGAVTSGKKTRTRKKALEQILDEAMTFVADKQGVTIFVCHSGSITDANLLAERLQAMLPEAELFVQHISPVMGVHIGPNAVGISATHS